MIQGSISASGGPVLFVPPGQRFLSFSIHRGSKLVADAYACLDCGCVCGSTDPAALRAFIERHCDPPKANGE